MTDKIKYAELELPNYTNTRPVIGNLSTVDLVKAAVLAPLNVLLIGDRGTGKTQLVKDVYNSYFGGNKAEGGEGIFIRAHPEIDVYNEIFTELDLERAKRKLTGNIDALLYAVDELNRAPTVAQNQFFGLGDGIMDYQGRSILLGRNGYRLLMATANLGNGTFQGTFETDEALHNRLHVTLDLDYEMFKPTVSDKLGIRHKGAVNPNVKEAEKKDLSDKVVAASREISERTLDPGIEASAVANYIEFGLDNCMKNQRKGKIWPLDCQGCSHNADAAGAVCSYIRSPVERTMQAMIKYATALDFIAKLKNPDQSTDAVELMFKSFELTGAYQSLLNPMLLRQDYLDQNPKFMAAVVEKLKEDFRRNEDFILTSIEQARVGNKVVNFFENDGVLGDYDSLSPSLRQKFSKIEPYSNNREIGLGWMNDYVDFLREINGKK